MFFCQHKRGVETPRTLVVTNDFPPRVGGVQQYVSNLVGNLPPDRVAVLAPNWPGWRRHDAALPFPVFRFPPTFLWPTRELARKVRIVANETEAEVVVFGHGLPLGLLGPDLAREGLPYIVLTHGTEYWFSLLLGTGEALHRATSLASRVTAISRFTGRVVRTAVPQPVPVSLLPPGVDTERFRPDVDGQPVRARYQLFDRPVVAGVSRLVRRKGQDVLIRAMATIRRRVPDAVLLVVGDGPDRERLRALADSQAPQHSVVFAGAVSDADLPSLYAAADVFAMPCRSRLAGLEVEGFGIVFLEAAASGRPVVAGDSGGAAEAVVDGETGLVVDGRHVGAVAEATAALLQDPVRAAAMGKSARARAERLFQWPRLTACLRAWLAEAAR
jgi:phosphatidylinositol alpha-1,6-mannosyltransferase